MNDYRPRAADQRFILEQVLQAPARLQALRPYAEVDADLMFQVLEEASTFVAEVVAPLNAAGDRVGARHRLTDGVGQVTMPPGFREAYQAFWQSGWPALHCAPEHGGQGLPAVLEAILYEMLSGANHGWTMAPGLLHGAYECVRLHGSAALQETYLEKIATGEWLATMCLTEPQAGSDLGLVRTRAEPLADGRYAITGSKIFISGGDHDLSDNIVHLVLARLPDAPPGPKGLSLFLVPKFYPGTPGADGGLGARSAVFCDRIEEKMGLHGSPTCAMRFEGAAGWMVGAPGKGLNAMFAMMNAARLHVALQGVGLLDAAWQRADAYARERRQMRAPGALRGNGEADPIAAHPAIRRILEPQRAWVDAARVLAYASAVALDVAAHHADPDQRAEAQNWCALVTPVMKATFTQQAFEGASACLQVFGGHGYVREWGIEQIVRDSRVAMIYEGTNEIQAIDLLVRKVLPDGAQGWGALCAALQVDWAEPGHAATPPAQTAVAQLQTTHELAMALCAAAAGDAVLAYDVADDFLRLAALALMAWASARIVLAAANGPEAERWTRPQQALGRSLRAEFAMRQSLIMERLL